MQFVQFWQKRLFVPFCTTKGVKKYSQYLYEFHYVDVFMRFIVHIKNVQLTTQVLGTVSKPFRL